MNTKAKERLTLDDTIVTAAMKMAGGNPGALRVCIEIIQRGAGIDPKSFDGGLSALMLLDSLGIYGPRIWMLYKDVCKGNLTHTIACLRAYQLGIIQERELQLAIDDKNRIDTDEILALVKERLGDFGLSGPPKIDNEQTKTNN